MTSTAYTACTGAGYPPYFNATIEDDEVRVTVRAPATGEGPALREGVMAVMRIPLAEFRRIHADIGAAL